MSTTILTDEQIFDCFDRQRTEICINFDADELYPVGRAIEQAVLRSPEVQALRKDAERYGKLVSAWLDDDHSGDFILMNNMPPDAYQSKADIDEDIDAMERQP